MSTETPKVSRYRLLRGKSVSEARKNGNRVTDEPDDGNSPSSPVRTSTLGSPAWRKRSKTLMNFEAEDTAGSSHHIPVPPIPTPPAYLKEHVDSARPRAAVMPSPFTFGDPSSPTPLGKHRLTHALSSQYELSSITMPFEADASEDDGRNGSRVKEEVSPVTGSENNKHQIVEDDDPIILAKRLEAETDRILAEQKKLDLARLHQQLITTRPATSVTTPPSLRTPTKSLVLERLGFFSRTRKSHVMLSPAPSTTASIDFARAQSMEPLLTPRTVMDRSPHLVTPPLTPLSPMNNDRHIIVCYRGEYVSIPVKIDTSTVDILRRASEMMTSPINISASIVLESWAPHGLERRLRRYERIHDVLDSWNHDAQSSLLILHSLGPTSDKDLDISSVPTTESPTPGLNLQLHHCTRPGRWHKRWITLLGDGLLVASKKMGAGPADRDSQRLCHLSTYDIYNLLSKLSSNLDDGNKRSPRGTPMKNLKPPKRYVFALKSQQKPTIYTDTSNFVHFFCTEDRDVAQEFHDRIHAWRSWYMVRTRRELQTTQKLLDDEFPDSPVEPKSEVQPNIEPEKQSEPQVQTMDTLSKHGLAPKIESVPQITPVKHNTRKSVHHFRVSPGHKMRLSIDETPYTIGAFQPLVDLERFDKPIEEFGKDWIPTTERLSLLSTTPGTDSGASEATALTTPSSKGPFTLRRDDVDFSSPSEERRKRRDHKRSLASSGATEGANHQSVASEGDKDDLVGVSAPQTTPDGASTSDSNGNFNEELLVEPETPPKPEPLPWLPSAAEHTAKVREEQKLLDRLSYPILPPQRPMTSSGVINHNTYQAFPQERRGARGTRGTQRGQPVLPSTLVCHYKAATQWVEDTSSSKYLEVPGTNHNLLRSMPSMPILVETATSGRNGLVPDTPAVPIYWRDQSLSSAIRPTTSGKDKSATSGHRPSLSGRDLSNPSSRRPSMTSGRGSPTPSHGQITSSGERHGRPSNGRTGSGTSLRRSFVGVGSPPGEELPPIPPVPSHLRQLAKDGRSEPGAALGLRAPGMLQRSSTTLR